MDESDAENKNFLEFLSPEIVDMALNGKNKLATVPSEAFSRSPGFRSVKKSDEEIYIISNSALPVIQGIHVHLVMPSEACLHTESTRSPAHLPSHLPSHLPTPRTCPHAARVPARVHRLSPQRSPTVFTCFIFVLLQVHVISSTIDTQARATTHQRPFLPYTFPSITNDIQHSTRSTFKSKQPSLLCPAFRVVLTYD